MSKRKFSKVRTCSTELEVIFNSPNIIGDIDEYIKYNKNFLYIIYLSLDCMLENMSIELFFNFKLYNCVTIGDIINLSNEDDLDILDKNMNEIIKIKRIMVNDFSKIELKKSYKLDKIIDKMHNISKNICKYIAYSLLVKEIGILKIVDIENYIKKNGSETKSYIRNIHIKKNLDNNLNTKHGFHGSCLRNVLSIVLNGIDIKSKTREMVNGNCYGDGIYLTNNNTKCLLYCKRYRNVMCYFSYDYVDDEQFCKNVKVDDNCSVIVINDKTKLFLNSINIINFNCE